jgi:glycosyltransferase involved in cell wall biosynthesis
MSRRNKRSGLRTSGRHDYPPSTDLKIVGNRGTKLAVLIPTYNAAGYIKECIDSVLNNITTPAPLQAVYIADDGSTDGTVEVATANSNKMVPIRICAFDKNVGECANVNRALRLMKREGVEWVLLLHHDDLLVNSWPDFVWRLLPSVPPDVGMICCRNAYTTSTGRLAAILRAYNRTLAAIITGEMSSPCEL